MINIIVLLGESASGKSTIERELSKKGLNRIISYTTRPIRKKEIDGIDYHFISKNKFFNNLANEFFAEYTKYNDWYYAIAKEDCLDNSVCVVEPHGYRQLKKIPDLHIKSFYIKVPERERLKRMVDRGDDLMEVFRRIFSDQGVFQSIDQEVDFIVLNHDLDKCVNEIINKIGRDVLMGNATS